MLILLSFACMCLQKLVKGPNGIVLCYLRKICVLTKKLKGTLGNHILAIILLHAKVYISIHIFGKNFSLYWINGSDKTALK